MPKSRDDSNVPLTPVAFDILLALLDGASHGYAIMRSVEERTGGATSLHAGTLYRALSRLVDAELIREVDEPPEAGADERRRYYRVTETGRAAAAAREFAHALVPAVAPVPVRLVDERLTTVSATRDLRAAGRTSRNSRAVVDQAAAVAIVQYAVDLERASGDAPGILVQE